MPWQCTVADTGYGMTVQDNVRKPLDRLSEALTAEMEAVNALIRDRMASRHAPRIPEVTAHLIEAGGKRLRPMLTLAAAKLLGYPGPWHVIWPPRSNSSIPPRCCMTTWSTKARSGAGARRRTCCGTTSPACWSEITCSRAAFS